MEECFFEHARQVVFQVDSVVDGPTGTPLPALVVRESFLLNDLTLVVDGVLGGYVHGCDHCPW